MVMSLGRRMPSTLSCIGKIEVGGFLGAAIHFCLRDKVIAPSRIFVWVILDIFKGGMFIYINT